MDSAERQASDKQDVLIRMQDVSKRYGALTALKNISLDVHEGEFLTLLGPSGSGKTTSLMCLAGFEIPTDGRISYCAKDITRLPPEMRGFGVVFQGYALFPHMTVAENVAYPLVIRKMPKAEREARVRAMLATVGLDGFEDRRTQSLSGGQQQRVALARALVLGPKLLLLDEPFSALDRRLRTEMQSELVRIHDELGTAFVFVTHDQDEALSLSDRIAVFNKGSLEQVATPSEIYETPASVFIAGFVGETNLLDVSGVETAGPGLYRARLGRSDIVCKGPKRLTSQQSSKLSIRPEEVELHTATPQGDFNAIQVRLLRATYFGGSFEVVLEDAAGTHFRVRLGSAQARGAGLADGREYWLSWPRGAGYLVPA